jgi:hypothetical protein
MLNVVAVPVQPPAEGVTDTLEVSAVDPEFKAVKLLISPVPLEARPVPAFVLVQVYVAAPPIEPLIVIAVVVAPAQTVWLVMLLTVGVWFTVTVKEPLAEGHPPDAATELVTVYVPAEVVPRLITPVLALTKFIPAGVAENVPAVEVPRFGDGLVPPIQYVGVA